MFKIEKFSWKDVLARDNSVRNYLGYLSKKNWWYERTANLGKVTRLTASLKKVSMTLLSGKWMNGSCIYKIKAPGISSSEWISGSLLLKSSQVFANFCLHLLKMFKGLPSYCLSSSSSNRVIATFQFVQTIALQLRLFAWKSQLPINNFAIKLSTTCHGIWKFYPFQ